MDTSIGSAPGYTRPVLIIQSNKFNQSKIDTVIVVPVYSNLALAKARGNVLISPKQSGLDRDSVVNVSQLQTIDKDVLRDYTGRLNDRTMEKVTTGVKLVLEII